MELYGYELSERDDGMVGVGGAVCRVRIVGICLRLLSGRRIGKSFTDSLHAELFYGASLPFGSVCADKRCPRQMAVPYFSISSRLRGEIPQTVASGAAGFRYKGVSAGFNMNVTDRRCCRNVIRLVGVIKLKN